VGFFLTLAQ